ncbi:DNA polymerase mu [Boletus edulis BED1]|uniref:DNA polymerase n=1 Tax=Boletus edulis BED1 TaxID=1328754 RepID=A0AAD4BMN3_BOLED|nr:DNA polymerase mu [Boletus edulis BED1]
MPLKRSHSSASPSDGGTSSDQGPSKRTHAQTPDTRGSSIDQYPLTVYIISAKLAPGELDNLVSLFEQNDLRGNKAGARKLELTSDLDHADVIVAAIRTRPRLERHVGWEVAKTKAIVTPDWLRDSVHSGTPQPRGKYAALVDLRDETESLCPKADGGTPAPPEESPNYHGQPSVLTDPEASVKATDLAAMNHFSQFCCLRASQLICPNQALVEELDIIRRARFFEGEERSMLSYARAIATIKAYPRCFDGKTPREHIAKLPYLGTKLTSMVEEFVKTGKIQEAQIFLSSTRFLSLSAFNSIHGIGPHTARHLYTLGLRSIEDLEKYYEVTITHEGTSSQFEVGTSNEIGVDKSIRVSLALRHDFSQKIPRQEAEGINRVIMRELEPIEEGCKSVIVGGYRRGKLESNDVDIVISHTDWDHGAEKVPDLCKKLVQRLHERGLVTHVLNMSGYHPHNVFRTDHWDSLEKALTVFVLPYDSARKQIYRRVDLIFATPDVFWTAVVGWTGSTMFERDLRLWAKQAKHFDSSGITRRHDSKLFYPKSEREVFELLGLVYVHPTLRNADA